MILNKSTQAIIRILLNEKEKKPHLREIAQKAGISLGMTAKIVSALEATGLIKKQKGVTLLHWEKLLKGWANLSSLQEQRSIQFLGAERPEYLIKKITSILRTETYALTIFAATEFVAPYVAPNAVHLYILEKDIKKITALFSREGIIQAEKGNIICYTVDESHFFGTKKIHGVAIISLPQLYADLISYGGRGEEAAEMILKMMREDHV